MGCEVDVTYHITSHVICHVTCHVTTTLHIIAMSATMSLAMSIDTSSLLSMSLVCNVAIEFVTKITHCDIYFRHRKQAWVGLRGPGDILWRFRNIMDQAIYDKNLRNVTRCDLWRSIHDVIWDRHRYCFMTVFSDPWRNLIVMDQQIFCSETPTSRRGAFIR